MLHRCPAHSPHQVQFSCRCCQPLRSPRPLESGTSIIGMATASCPAIISRRTTTFPFMVRREQSATHRSMLQDTGITAGCTISAILDFPVGATMAAVSARAGLGRPSGRCGIVGRNLQKVWPDRRSARHTLDRLTFRRWRVGRPIVPFCSGSSHGRFAYLADRFPHMA
jgi:hypothetical protein